MQYKIYRSIYDDHKGCSSLGFQPELLHQSKSQCFQTHQNYLIQKKGKIWDFLADFQTLSTFLTANQNKKCISMFWLAKKDMFNSFGMNEFPRSLRSVVSMDCSSYDPHKMSLQWPVESFNKTTNVTEKRRKKKLKIVGLAVRPRRREL